MSGQASPSWFITATRRRTSYSSMRISDSERTEAADLLSKHYGDGRLDEGEFHQRLDQLVGGRGHVCHHEKGPFPRHDDLLYAIDHDPR